MPHFYRFTEEGITAFNDNNEMVMTGGRPIIQWYLTVPEVQEFVQTLEQAYEDEPNYLQRNGLQRIVCTLKAALIFHDRQHEEMLQASQTGPDLEDYLFAYSNAMAKGEVK